MLKAEQNQLPVEIVTQLSAICGGIAVVSYLFKNLSSRRKIASSGQNNKMTIFIVILFRQEKRGKSYSTKAPIVGATMSPW
jgi:hypothetical protein